MLATLLITCVVSLGVSTLLLLLLGHRIGFRSRLLGLILGSGLLVGSGELAARLFDLSPDLVIVSEVAILAVTMVVIFARPQWNPVGQVFYGSFVAAALTYLALAAQITVAGGLSPAGIAASALLFVLESIALFLSASFAFEGCDAICRVEWPRELPERDPGYLPKVSLQVPAYNEPADMLIETVKTLERIDYPDLEIIVIDNNTEDPEVWRPVEEYCRDRERVRFFHEEVEGFKAGALNLVMERHIAPDAEIIGIVDADYLLDSDFLKETVGYFSDPSIAFVQTPQDYREYEGDTYLTACYDAYNYFFKTTMPSRNQRDSIIFAGTMGLIRRSALESVGGWTEECITEDAETSLRLLKVGYSGLYIPKSYGRGIMPLSFAAFKVQRFRWALGGIQILRMHWRDLLPWRRDPDNHLSPAQKMDYFLGSFQWFNDLIYLGFSTVLLVTAYLVATKGSLELRPLIGAVVLLPTALIVSGLVRAMWSLRHRTGIGLKRGLLAFLNWLSVSWTVALACMRGLVSSKAAFLRTPKQEDDKSALDALWAARSETLIALALWGSAVAVGITGGTAFLIGLFIWQGTVYASAPLMSWMNVHTELSAQLERRRRTEHLRDRLAAAAPYAAAGVSLAGVVALALVIGFGGSEPGDQDRNPFRLPERSDERAPFELLSDRFEEVEEGAGAEVDEPGPEPAEEEAPQEDAPSPTSAPEPSPSPSPSPTPTPSPSPST